MVALLAMASATAFPENPVTNPAPTVVEKPKPPAWTALESFGVPDIVFAVRKQLDEHWYANFGYYAPDANWKAYRDGGKLCRIDLRTGKVTTLLDDPAGGVRDPQVHYNGKKILFSYRKGGTPNYLLHEINADGTGLRQLTDGTFDDFEPSYLPDGGIVFVSSRCRRWVNCWLTQVATIHRCDADGKNIRALSANIEHDNTPWPLPDGRLLYTRWEYIDRSQVNYHHLWTMNPDGTAQTIYFGNYHPGSVYIDAKPIPGSDRIVLSNSPGHGAPEHAGFVATVSAKFGPDALADLHNISHHAGYRDPWAFSEDCFLAAHNATVVVMNALGEKRDLFQLSDAEIKDGFTIHEPRPLQPRARENVLASRVQLAATTGRFLLENVNVGRNMTGVQPGEITKLLVIESLPKPINYTGGMEPLSYGGTFTLERVLGAVPVEPDGSAYFEVPAMRSVFFVALDKNDLAVKRMQSFTSVQPGETQGCVGCHEDRTQTKPVGMARRALAAKRAPSRIEPVAGVPDVLDFPRDIQPILDRHCLKCHDWNRRSDDVILSGDHGPMYSHSYFTLTTHQQLADGRNEAKSNYPPRALGSGAAPLMKKLDGSHHDVRVSERERVVIRLWLDTGAPYPGTYAALGTGMIGGYQQNDQRIENDRGWTETRAAGEMMGRRCASCHDAQGKPLPRALSDEAGFSFWMPEIKDRRIHLTRHILFNLTRPDESLILRGPLAKEAGGVGSCVGTNGVAVFANKDDADYRVLLSMCEAGKRRLDEVKRFDMPGFRPREAWVREMKRFGVLPGDFDVTKQVVDVYAVERRYWESFDYQGSTSGENRK